MEARIMMNRTGMAFSIAILALVPCAHADPGPRCRTLDAQLVEVPGTNCSAEHPGCFVGELRGHGAHAITEFFGTSGAPGPSGSPGWFTYSGETQYHFRKGSLLMHETGLGTSSPDLPAITSAVEIITGGDGNLAGATGTLFVNGFNGDVSVVTHVTGTFCVPRDSGDSDDLD
jgi:hypothetical protein